MGSSVDFRKARGEDLPELIAMLQDDPRGSLREDSDNLTPYVQAFKQISLDPNQLILVAEKDERIVGSLQISYIPGLSYKGSWRAEIEGVRVQSDCRGQGIGKMLIRKAIDLARARGCRIVQLTSSKTRKEAIAFYQKLGFEDSHAGMKMILSE